MNGFLKFYEQIQGEWKKKVKPHKCVGLALEEDHLFAAEVYRRKEGFSLGKTARFEFPDDASLSLPHKLGEALKQFLRENGFAARKVAVGIPAKWIMTREMTLPPSPSHAVSGALKIHAEREFSLNPEDLALDYTGVLHSGQPSRLVLSAMLKKRMQQIQETLRSAGLEPLSVSASAAALFELAGKHEAGALRPRFALLDRPAYLELLVRVGEEIVEVKYFQKRVESGRDASLGEVDRALSSYMKRISESGEAEILLWSESGDSEEIIKETAGALPPGVTPRRLSVQDLLRKIRLSGERDHLHPFGPGLALALGVFGDPAPSVADFQNSRMEAQVSRIEKRHVRMAAMVAGAVLVLLIGMIVSWKMNVSEVAELKETLAERQADIDMAKDIVDKVAGAGGWYGRRPRVLDCLRELTLQFPEEGRVWSSSLALNEEMNGIISGKALSEQDVIEVMDGMKKSPSFSDVQMVYMRDSGKESQEISFSMSFVFVSG